MHRIRPSGASVARPFRSSDARLARRSQPGENRSALTRASHGYRSVESHGKQPGTRPAGETAQEPTDAVAVRRRHARAADLTRLGVQPVRRDLRAMLVESHYDRHAEVITLHG